MKKITSHPQFWKIGGLLMLDALVFGVSNPQQVPSFMLAVGFVLLVVTVYQLLLAVLLAANWYGLPGRAHRRRQARVATGVFGGLIALQSIGELGGRDVTVLLPLALIAYVYISYGKGRSVKGEIPGQSRPTSLLSVD